MLKNIRFYLDRRAFCIFRYIYEQIVFAWINTTITGLRMRSLVCRLILYRDGLATTEAQLGRLFPDKIRLGHGVYLRTYNFRERIS